MTQPRAKRVRPILKRQRPERSAKPTPERIEWVRAEILRRIALLRLQE